MMYPGETCALFVQGMAEGVADENKVCSMPMACANVPYRAEAAGVMETMEQ